MPRSASPAASAAAVIHDIGYQPYRGARLGRPHIVGALYAHRLRAAFGLGRSARYKVVPLGLLTLMCVPALVSAAVTALIHLPGLAYGMYAYFLQVVVVLFLAAQASQLVTTDLRFHVLPLYFSRPLVRGDYALTVLAAMATAMLLLLGAPLLLLYAGALLGLVHGAGDVAAQTGHLLQGLAGAVLGALLLSALGLAAAAFSRRRAFAVLAVICPYLVLQTTVAIVVGLSRGSVTGSLAGLLSPFDLLQGVQVWLLGAPATFPGVPGSLGALYAAVLSAATAGAAGLLLVRYRRIDL
jgi:ABC-2 type transport system permease protein